MGFSLKFLGLENNLFAYWPSYKNWNTSCTIEFISIVTPSSGPLLFKVKNTSYFVVSKSPAVLGGYFLGLPLPLFGNPSRSSGCFVFLWLFKAGWLKNAFPQSHAKSLPFCSCLDLLCLSIILKHI